MNVTTDHLFCLLVPVIRPLVVGRIGAARRRYFEGLPASQGQVVLLGDSITEQGKWADLFPELRTANRGIGGESTADLLERLHCGIFQPKAVSLLIGTNDLHGPRDQRALAGIGERADEIVRRLREELPSAAVFVNSIMPRTPYFTDRIQTLNEHYRDIAKERGATFVDVWPALADDAGAIRKEFTKDNLHLSPAGYRAWADVLRPHFAAFQPSACI